MKNRLLEKRAFDSRLLRVFVDQESDRGAEAGRETARREERHFLNRHLLLPFFELESKT